MGRPLQKYIVNSIKCTCKLGTDDPKELALVEQVGRGRFIVEDGGSQQEIRLVSKADFDANEEAGTGYVNVTVGAETKSMEHLTKNLIYFCEADAEPATFFFDLILDETGMPVGVYQPAGVARIDGITEDPEGKVTFTINPTPEDATVKLNDVEQASITVAKGTEVSWEVSKESYTTRSGKVTPQVDATLDVILEAAASSEDQSQEAEG